MIDCHFGWEWSEEIPDYFRGDVDAPDSVDEELRLQTRALLFDESKRTRVQLLVEELRARLHEYLAEPELAHAIEEVAGSPEELSAAESMLSPPEEVSKDSLGALLAWVRSMANRHERREKKRARGAGASRQLPLGGDDQDSVDSQLSAFAYDSGAFESERSLELREATLKVLLAARELEPREYSVFVLRSLDQFSFAAIGNMLGATEMSVRSQYYYALDKLREWLARGPGAGAAVPG